MALVNSMTGKIYQIDGFILDTKTRQFFNRGKAVSISSKAFDILECLIENHGKIVKKSELLETVWSDSFVEESNLPVHISALRRVLGETRGESRFIKTIPGRGYSFIWPVQELDSVSESTIHFPHKSSDQKKLNEQPAIAVLPFTFDLTNSDFEYLANGITQSLIDDLSHSSSLKVLAYSAVRNYCGTSLELPEIGFLLGANKILTGHISQYKDKLEISVELVNAHDKSHIWSAEQFFDLNDIFRVKKEISLAIAEKLKLKLTDSDRNDFAKQQELDPEAHKLYFRGKFVWDSRVLKSNFEESLLLSLKFFQLTLEKEPNYALAHIGIGNTYVSLHNHHLHDRNEAFARTQKSIEMALKIDSRLPQAFVLKGLTQMWFERKYAEAEKSLSRAIELNPNNAEAYHWKSNIFLSLGRFDDAITAEAKAIQFDPTSLLSGEHLVRISYFRGYYHRTIAQAEELLEFEKSCTAGYLFLALSYAHLGLFKQSLENIEKAIESRHTAEIILIKAYIHALMNDKFQAKKLISNVLNQFPEIQVDSGDLAYVYSALSETEKAFDQLEKAFESSSTSLCLLKIEKRCENLRRDPRFKLFLEKVGLS